MRALVLQAAVAAPFAVALTWLLACANTAPSPGFGDFGGASGGPVPIASASRSPDRRIDCTSGISAFCSGSSSGCVPDWTLAEMSGTWAAASPDGCARVATAPCAGFMIADVGRTDQSLNPPVREFFDQGTGALVAVVAVTDPTSSQCVAGPPGFTDPLIINCEPPVTLICSGLDAGVDATVDAPEDATVADAETDGGAG